MGQLLGSITLADLAAGKHTIAWQMGQTVAKGNSPDPSQVERGKYLVTIGGCNDCHTSGYMENNGKVNEENWLTGSPLDRRFFAELFVLGPLHGSRSG